MGLPGVMTHHEISGDSGIIWSNYSDLTRPHPKRWFSKGNPLISGKSRLVKYYNLPRIMDNPTEITWLLDAIWPFSSTHQRCQGNFNCLAMEFLGKSLEDHVQMLLGSTCGVSGG